MVSQIEAEEKVQGDQLFATTEELEKAWSRIRSMEEEVEKAKVDAPNRLVRD